MNDNFIMFNELNAIAGYVENGTSSSILISQDDATKWWTVTVGSKSWTRESMREALADAYEDLKQF